VLRTFCTYYFAVVSSSIYHSKSFISLQLCSYVKVLRLADCLCSCIMSREVTVMKDATVDVKCPNDDDL